MWNGLVVLVSMVLFSFLASSPSLDPIFDPLSTPFLTCRSPSSCLYPHNHSQPVVSPTPNVLFQNRNRTETTAPPPLHAGTLCTICRAQGFSCRQTDSAITYPATLSPPQCCLLCSTMQYCGLFYVSSMLVLCTVCAYKYSYLYSATRFSHRQIVHEGRSSHYQRTLLVLIG